VIAERIMFSVCHGELVVKVTPKSWVKLIYFLVLNQHFVVELMFEGFSRCQTIAIVKRMTHSSPSLVIYYMPEIRPTDVLVLKHAPQCSSCILYWHFHPARKKGKGLCVCVLPN